MSLVFGVQEQLQPKDLLDAIYAAYKQQKLEYLAVYGRASMGS